MCQGVLRLVCPAVDWVWGPGCPGASASSLVGGALFLFLGL